MYRHILVTLDGSIQGEWILAWVRPLVQESKGRVRLLKVYPPMQTVTMGKRIIAYGHQLEAQAHMTALAYLRTVATRLQGDGISVSWQVWCGDPVEAIIEVAGQRDIDLIAMATHGTRGVRRLVHRSITAEVLHRASVPVLVARHHDQRAA